jgi:hypothetical protein
MFFDDISTFMPTVSHPPPAAHGTKRFSVSGPSNARATIGLVKATRLYVGVERLDAAWTQGRALAFETAASEAVAALEEVLSV